MKKKTDTQSCNLVNIPPWLTRFKMLMSFDFGGKYHGNSLPKKQLYAL